MTSKEAHRINLLEYLGNPEINFPIRAKYNGVLGITKQAMYLHFTPEELTQIEFEAVEIRKKRSNRQRTKVLKALYKRALGYSHPEVKVQWVESEVYNQKEQCLLNVGRWGTIKLVKHYPPDKAAGQEFLDRTEGKVPDKVHLGGPGGEPIQPILNINTKKAKNVARFKLGSDKEEII